LRRASEIIDELAARLQSKRPKDVPPNTRATASRRP